MRRGNQILSKVKPQSSLSCSVSGRYVELPQSFFSHFFTSALYLASRFLRVLPISPMVKCVHMVTLSTGYFVGNPFLV